MEGTKKKVDVRRRGGRGSGRSLPSATANRVRKKCNVRELYTSSDFSVMRAGRCSLLKIPALFFVMRVSTIYE